MKRIKNKCKNKLKQRPRHKMKSRKAAVKAAKAEKAKNKKPLYYSASLLSSPNPDAQEAMRICFGSHPFVAVSEQGYENANRARSEAENEARRMSLVMKTIIDHITATIQASSQAEAVSVARGIFADQLLPMAA